MEFRYSARFKKQYKKLPEKVQLRFDDRVTLFSTNPSHPILRNHPLVGNFVGYWSINISGDIRALYRYDGGDVIIFALIGTHSELYGK
jgi:addiction module RelE/StbE family toxin